MKNWEVRLSGKTLAAAVVLGFGAVMALASMAAQSNASLPSNPQAITAAIVEERDHVQPRELAQWILEKRTDYQLIDLRAAWEFDDYHIPTAVHIPLDQLFTDAGLKQLERGKKIVVYGLGAGHPAQASLLLTLKGYQAYSLKEGITAWWDEVMTPQSLRGESPDPAGYQQLRQLRQQFSGGPATPAASSGAAPSLPSMPASPGSGAPKKKLKLGRGCS
jgi:rhodanese-related sulfurtransferase